MTGSSSNDGELTRRGADGMADEQVTERGAREAHDEFMRRKYRQMFDDRLLAADFIEDDLGVDILDGRYRAPDGDDGRDAPGTGPDAASGSGWDG